MHTIKNNDRCNPGAVSRFKDGELDAAAAGRLQTHLDTCPSCRQELEAQQAVSRRFRAVVAAERNRIDFDVLERRIVARAGEFKVPFFEWVRRIVMLKRIYIPAAATATALILFLWVYTPMVTPVPSAIVTSFSGDISTVMILETPETHQTILWFNEKPAINGNNHAI